MTVRAMFRIIVEVLAWGAVVAAGGFVVAAADGFVEWVAVGIDVEGEAAGTAAGWAGVWFLFRSRCISSGIACL